MPSGRRTTAHGLPEVSSCSLTSSAFLLPALAPTPHVPCLWATLRAEPPRHWICLPSWLSLDPLSVTLNFVPFAASHGHSWLVKQVQKSPAILQVSTVGRLGSVTSCPAPPRRPQ